MKQGENQLNTKPSDNWLEMGFYLSCLFPFISPIPTQTDLQPIFIIFAVVLFFKNLDKNSFSSKKKAGVFLSTLSLIYINPFSEDAVEIGKIVSILVGALSYVAAAHLNSWKAFRILKFVSTTYLIVSLLILVDSGLFLNLQSHIVRGINVKDIYNLTYRGIPALSTEPGLLGGLLVFILIQIQYYGEIISAPRREIFLYSFITIISIALTKSGTGYLYLFVFVILKYQQINPRKVIQISAIVVGVFLTSIALFPLLEAVGVNNRGIETLLTLLSGEVSDTDTSILKRVYDIRIGFESLLVSPFGNGINGVSSAIIQIGIENNLVIEGQSGFDNTLVSGLAYYLVAYGFIGVLFIVFLFGFYSSAPFLHKVFAFLFLAVSYSPAFPAIWILLSQKNFRKKVLLYKLK
jgi:hypothetical protein